MIVHIPFKPPLHISHLLTLFFILIILLQMMKMVILLGFFILSFLHTQLNNFTHTNTHFNNSKNSLQKQLNLPNPTYKNLQEEAYISYMFCSTHRRVEARGGSVWRLSLKGYDVYYKGGRQNRKSTNSFYSLPHKMMSVNSNASVGACMTRTNEKRVTFVSVSTINIIGC